MRESESSDNLCRRCFAACTQLSTISDFLEGICRTNGGRVGAAAGCASSSRRAPRHQTGRLPSSWRVVDPVVKGAMCARRRNQAQRDRRPAVNRLEKLMRLVALVLGGDETLAAALPGAVPA